MGRQRYTPKQIIGELREAEVAPAKGRTVVEVARTLGITEQTYYRWSTEYGGLKVEQATRPWRTVVRGDQAARRQKTPVQSIH